MQNDWAGVRESVVQLPNGRLHYYEHGHRGRPPVVLLHGGGPDNAKISWQHTLPPLGEHYHVAAPDLPKHGESRPWRGKVTQEVLEQSVLDLIDSLALERVTLAGISMGGSAALGVSLKHPERVARLVLVDSGGLQERAPWHRTSYFMVKLPFLRWLMAWMLSFKRLIRASLQRQLFRRRVPDVDELAEQLRREVRRRRTIYSDYQIDELRWRRLKTNFLPRVERIHCPTLVVHGGRDSLVPRELAREVARRVPRAVFHELADLGHWPNREDPDTFNRVLTDFLRRTDPDLAQQQPPRGT